MSAHNDLTDVAVVISFGINTIGAYLRAYVAYVISRVVNAFGEFKVTPLANVVLVCVLMLAERSLANIAFVIAYIVLTAGELKLTYVAEVILVCVGAG